MTEALATRFGVQPGREEVFFNGERLSLEEAWGLADALRQAHDASEAPGCYCICMVEYRPCPVHRIDKSWLRSRLTGRSRQGGGR